VAVWNIRGAIGPEPALVLRVKEATMTTKRHKARTGGGSKSQPRSERSQAARTERRTVQPYEGWQSG
jgi:hypothetical protein